MSDDEPEGRLSFSIATPMEQWTPQQMAAFGEAIQIVMEHNFSRPRRLEIEEESDDE